MKTINKLYRISDNISEKTKRVNPDIKKDYNEFIQQLEKNKGISLIIELCDRKFFTIEEMLLEVAFTYYRFFKASRIGPLNVTQQQFDAIKKVFPELTENKTEI